MRVWAGLRSRAPFVYLVAVCVPVVAEALLTALGAWDIRPSPATLATVAFLVGGTIVVALLPLDRIWVFAAALGLASVVVVLSGAALGAIVAAIVIAAAYGLGAAVVRVVAPDAEPADRSLYAAPIGLGLLSYAMLALGLCGLLVPLAGLAVIGGALVIGSRELGGAGRAAAAALRRPAPERAGPLLFAAAVWAIVVLIEAVAPEVQFDALSYHLGLPRVWIDAGRLLDVPEQTQSYFYLGAEMNFALAMMLGGQVAAKLVSFGYLALASAAIHSFTRRTFSARAAAIATALFVTTPAIAWQGSTTYIDVATTLYVFCGTVAAYRFVRSADRRSGVIAGGLLGLAVATKLTAVLAVGAVALVAAATLVARRSPHRRAAPAILTFGASLVIALAPWPILRFIQTGNPVFPLLNGVFHSSLWPDIDPGTAFALDRFGIGTDPLALARLPFALSYLAQRFDDGAEGAGFGVVVLLAPIAVVVGRRSPAVVFLALGSLLAFVVWAVAGQYGRYLLPVFAALSVLAGHGLVELERAATAMTARVARLMPVVLMLASFPLVLFLYPFVPGRIPFAVAFGLESREAYLDRTLPTYAALREVARSTGSASNVLIVSYRAGAADDEDRLYAPGRVETLTSVRVGSLYRLTDPELAAAWLRERRFTHILIDRHGLRPDLAAAAVTGRAFLDRYGTLEYGRGPVELYRLLPP